VEATRIGAMDFLEKADRVAEASRDGEARAARGESRAAMPLSIANFGRSVAITE